MRDLKPSLQFLTLALGDEAPRIAWRAALLGAGLLTLAILCWAGR